MHCQVCDHHETKVIESRNGPEGQTIRRRRLCTCCGHRFTTYEKFVVQLPVVVKEDGRRENYNREKILKGLKKACSKRPITMDQLSKLIDNLELHICESYTGEVPSHWIGEELMKKMKDLDPVSFVRFASFYCNFDDISGFIETIQNNNTIRSKAKVIKKKDKGKSCEKQLH